MHTLVPRSRPHPFQIMRDKRMVLRLQSIEKSILTLPVPNITAAIATYDHC